MNEHDRSEPVIDALLRLDDQNGPASRITPESAASLIDGALDQWQSPAKSARVVAWPGLRSFALAASALLAFVVGARAFYVWVTPPVVSPPHAASVVAAPRPSQPVTITSPVAVTERAPKSVEASPPTTQDRPQAAHEDWLLRANRLRAEGRFDDALQAYNRVIRRDNGVSSYVARVAAASLMLEHLNDPKGARALFLAAAQQLPGGALELEIRRGLVEASQRASQRTTLPTTP